MVSQLTILVACVVAVLGLMSGLTMAQRNAVIGAEFARKILHLGVGAVALSLPGLFGSDVWAIALLASGLAILTLFRLQPLLFSQVLGPLKSIDRKSDGDLWFLAGVCLVLLFSAGEGAPYYGAILILTLADAAAAVIGTRYGRVHYSVFRARRSLEGTAAFLLVAWACAAATLSVLAPGVPEIRAGFAVALISCVAEALSPRGSDNFSVPIVAWLGLHIAEAAYP